MDALTRVPPAAGGGGDETSDGADSEDAAAPGEEDDAFLATPHGSGETQGMFFGSILPKNT